MVAGYAIGGGHVLHLCCDLTIAADNAVFGEPEILFSHLGPALPMPMIIGHKRARELLYFGDTIDAQEAHRIGLANRVVPGETLMDEAYKWAAHLKDGPLYALGVTKELLEREGNTDLETALEMEAMAQARCMETPDFVEGYNAFIEKRPLRFNRS